jgi:SAM-dependent methyltransferase
VQAQFTSSARIFEADAPTGPQAIVVNRYTEKFYKGQQEGSRRSAERIVPLVLELVKATSVVDVGCGIGTWLAVFAEHGVTNIRGIDGEYVDRRQLQIGEDRFLAHDLAKPIRLNERFDLILCLEVAEHLDPLDAPGLINSLVNLGPRVLFSAAIPDQGGTHHLNEQWPDYWTELFAVHGYRALDCLRSRIWRDQAVEWWYAQNMLLFVDRTALEADQRLLRETHDTVSPPLSLVHPKRYAEAILELRLTREIAEMVPDGESFILVDDDFFSPAVLGRRRLPFLEKDGLSWGKPADDDSAIEELERMRRTGAVWMIFVWQSFWWLDYYAGLHRYLRSNFRCMKENDCVIVFDLHDRYTVRTASSR